MSSRRLRSESTTGMGAPRAGLGRDFTLFWLSEITNVLGTTVTSVALPLVAVTDLRASSFLVALLTAASWVPWIVIGLPAGAWVDRLPRRPIMLTCSGVSMVVIASVSVAAWLDVLTMTQLLVGAFVIGTANVFFTTAHQVFLPSLVDAAHVPAANARIMGSESAARVVGPGLAGVLVQMVGAASALLVDVASYAVSMLFLRAVRVRERHRSPAGERQTLRREVGEGLRFVARDRYLRPLVLFGAVNNVALTGIQALAMVFLVRDVGVSPATIGVLMAGVSGGGVLGAVLATRSSRVLGSARALLLWELGTAPFALLVPMTGDGATLPLFAFGYGTVIAGIVASNVIISSFRQLYCPPRYLGRVVASMRFVNYSAVPVGAVLGGGLSAAIGNRAVIWVMAVCMVLSGAILLASPIGRRRDLPAPTVDGPPLEQRVDQPAAPEPGAGSAEDRPRRETG